MNLIFITDNIPDATDLVIAGVDTIMIDLEINGKVERQGHLNTLISNHDFNSIRLMADALRDTSASILVRVNPMCRDTKREVDTAISLGASKLMLPMFRSSGEVELFLSYVNGRVPVTLLLETSTALARLSEILKVKGEFDIHIGLNDLHLDMRLNFMFELLIKDGIVEYISRMCKTCGRKFGIGGVSRLGGDAPLPAEYVLSEHARLGSSAVILSRDWRSSLLDGSLDYHVRALRDFLSTGSFVDSLLISKKISQIAYNYDE